MKTLIRFTYLTCISVLASSLALAEDLPEQFFNKQNPALTHQEKAALDIAKRWKAGSTNSTTAIAPFTGPNGTVQFVYGVEQPSIVCAVLQVCDIALQPGEQMNSFNLGDTARWLVEPALSGSADNEVLHLVVKPLDVGLTTSLDVFTNRRAYHIQLRSHRTEYMPKVAFVYPDEQHGQFAKLQAKQAKAHEEKIIPQTQEYLGDLNFNYSIDTSSNLSWTPVRVYNDGQKTVIQMPTTYTQQEAPSLLVVRHEGGVFTDDETVLVNYRVQGDRYIVDSVFDEAIMIAGVGGNQESVTIKRKQ